VAGFTINAVALHQKGKELYCFGMSSERLWRICYVTPRGPDNPEEIQRILDKGRAQQIGEYIKQANSLLPNAIVVSLVADVQVRDAGISGFKSLQFPADEGKFAYILDGQHRLAGFEYSGGINFELPVVALHNADDSLRGKIFADINSKQVRVTNVHLLSLYYQIRDLPTDEASVMDVINRLNTDPDSPLKGKVRMMDADRGCWIKNAAIKKWLSPHLTSGGTLGTRTVAEQAEIVKAYLTAVSKLWPEAWGDVRKFNLSRPIGLEIILTVFPEALHRCDLNCGRQYTAKNFESQLEPLRRATIDLPGGGEFTLDWQRGTMGTLSGKPGKRLVVRQLKDILNRADQSAESERAS